MQSSSVEFLESLLPRFKNLEADAERFGLLTRSEKFRDILSSLVIGKATTYDLFLTNFSTYRSVDLNFSWLASLGRVVGLQQIHECDGRNALNFLRSAIDHLPDVEGTRTYKKLAFEIAFSIGEYDEALLLLSAHQTLENEFFNYLSNDLENPFIKAKETNYKNWIRGFNNCFDSYDLQPICIAEGSGNPFDRLSAEAYTRDFKIRTTDDNGAEDPLVTVIMTSFDPEPDAIQNAVNSILNQTYQNLELIIVDDASPHDQTDLLTRIAAKDKRVRLVFIKENGGTYKARNRALGLSKGMYVTGQDSDDWSHPERIATQVAYLREHPESSGVIISAVRMDENLVRIIPGQIPNRQCEVSFMTLTSTALEVGGYLEVRKGADSEFRKRVERFTGRMAPRLEQPLYLIRMMPNSLSRGDFRPGWSHHNRRAFWAASLYWHTHSKRKKLRISNDSDVIPFPRKFQVIPHDLPDYDIVYMHDWRMDNALTRSMIDELSLLQKNGYSVGIIQAESIENLRLRTNNLVERLQKLINEGIITRLIPDDENKIELMVVRDLLILQFPSTQAFKGVVHRVVATPADARMQHESKDYQFEKEVCSANSKDFFGTPINWFKHVDMSEECSASSELHWPIVIDFDRFKKRRTRVNRKAIVVGRHASNKTIEWSEDDSISFLRNGNSTYDVRILGDARGVLRSSRSAYYPANWVVFRRNEQSMESFLATLDYFVYYPSKNSDQTICYEVLEAAASGVPVILPLKYEESHERVGVFANCRDAKNAIVNLETDPVRYKNLVDESSRGTKDFVENEAFIRYIESQIEISRKEGI